MSAKVYHRIPHLPGSRVGASDRTAAATLVGWCTAAARPGDEIIVQEKLDGSCVAVARRSGEVVALGREGRRAEASPNEGRRRFAAWVAGRSFDLLDEGEVLVGEWLALVHGVRYAPPHGAFVPFDLFTPSGRLGLDALQARLAGSGLVTPAVVHRGGALAVDEADRRLGRHGRHGAIDPAEGVVYRVERRGCPVALAKYVRAGKVDGLYLPERTGEPARWNTCPSSSPT